MNIAKYCYENSIGGFEFLRGIPGTLGGNIRMNAGCFGNLISDKLIKCKIMTRNGNIIEFSGKNKFHLSIENHQFLQTQLL